MSDDTSVELLLENFQSALDTLNKIGDLENLMAKLDTKKNQKLLKKVKNVVSDVHTKVNTIKGSVSKAYKRMKIRRKHSESDESAVDKDDSDKELDSDRYSPVIGGKGKSSKQAPEHIESLTRDHIEENFNSSAESNDNAKASKEQDSEDASNKEDKDDSHAVDNNGDHTEQDTDNQADEEDKDTQTDDDSEYNNVEKDATISNKDVIEATPEKGDREIDDCNDREHNNVEKDANISNDDIIEATPEKDLNSKTGDDNDREHNNVEKIAKDATPKKQLLIKLSCLPLNETKNDSEKVTTVDAIEDDSTVDPDPLQSQTKEKEDEKKKSKNKEQNDKAENEEKATTDESDDSQNSASETEPPQPTAPKIKLVDISKLLAPNTKPMEVIPSPAAKGRKSVSFDSSVIVLTSSDEDSPKKTSRKEKNFAKLKSAMRKTPPKTINLSDSDSKENNENLENSRQSSKSKAASKSSVSICSDNSDVEIKSSRLRKQVKPSENFARLVKERNERRQRLMEKKEKESIKRSKHNDDAKEKMDKKKSKPGAKKKKKKELLDESSLSDRSDDSDIEEVQEAPKSRLIGTKEATTASKEPDKNDPKFKLEVYIGLPKFKCEELPELYKKKKELFEIKKLCKLNLLHKTLSGRKEGKRLKPTVKPKVRDEEKASSSDGEASSSSVQEDNVATTIPVDLQQNGGDMEQLAMSCLEQVNEKSDTERNKSSEEDNSDEKDSEKTGTKKKSEKLAEKEKGAEAKANGKLSDSEEEDEKKQNKKRKRNKSDSGDEWQDSEKEESTKIVIESSDSDDDFVNVRNKKDKSKRELDREPKKKAKKKVISDSESDDEKEKKSDDGLSTDEKPSGSSASEAEEAKSDEDEENKPARRRIKRVKDSSSDDDDKSTRKQLRRMIDRDSLSETTKKAEQQEKERKARILEKQKKYNQIFELKADATVDQVVLDFDEKTKKPLLSVHKKIVKHLKPHQVSGIKFMWDACFESMERASKGEGSGCILAHCMGLGKTLQVIALIHTLLTNVKKTKVEKILVVCPVNTVLNWKSEFKKWMPNKHEFEIFELVSCKTNSVNHERSYIVNSWHEDGGVLIVGYNMFRSLSNPDNKAIPKKLKASFCTGLVDPGPDLVICDEGHLLKNEKTNLSIAMNRIKTARRIVLTGTPLQNNLREYWCMVQFIKPNLLGTYKEYMNRFVNPITNGQYTDSTQHDIMVMRRRSHVLHKLLDGVVQRQDYGVLEPYLPPKYEYVLFLKLTEKQIKLYQHYMNNFAKRGDGSNKTSFLFTDFQHLQRICTHPRVLVDKNLEDKEKKELAGDESESEGSLKDFIDDDSSAKDSSGEGGSTSEDSKSEYSDSSIKSDERKKKKKKRKSSAAQSSKRTRLTRAQAAQNLENGELSDDSVVETRPKEWWDEYIEPNELDNVDHSAKLFLLFQILKECEEIGDKILVFSQSLYSLNCIEYFLSRIDEATQKKDAGAVGGHTGSWALGLDYFRLDGSSSCDNRASWCDQFNDPDNIRARLFLISTKAGGLGINLVAANRVIIFDVSWNPSHDIQSIYRVYRFGQTKPSYVYRFVTYGAMEMKIYERQVTKQAISKRVIDEQQIDRHYSQNDIMELYKTDLEPEDRPIPLVPKDVLLAELLHKYEQTIYKYHEHQSLLENKHDEELNEEERKAAWDEFENEKVLKKTMAVPNMGGMNLGAVINGVFNFSPQVIQMALGNIVRKDNPAWSDIQIQGILPALVTQLQMQMSENDFSMYNRVQQEIKLMQAIYAQRMREKFLKEYQMQQMLQKQHLANQLLGNLSITPEELRRLQMAQAPPQNNAPGRSSDVIELND